MKIGDASRHRRFADPARQRWYAYHRAVRFAMRMMPPPVLDTPADEAALSQTAAAAVFVAPARTVVYDEVAAEVLFG